MPENHQHTRCNSVQNTFRVDRNAALQNGAIADAEVMHASVHILSIRWHGPDGSSTGAHCGLLRRRAMRICATTSLFQHRWRPHDTHRLRKGSGGARWMAIVGIDSNRMMRILQSSGAAWTIVACVPPDASDNPKTIGAPAAGAHQGTETTGNFTAPWTTVPAAPRVVHPLPPLTQMAC